MVVFDTKTTGETPVLQVIQRPYPDTTGKSLADFAIIYGYFNDFTK
jgi:hypothetical protein